MESDHRYFCVWLLIVTKNVFSGFSEWIHAKCCLGEQFIFNSFMVSAPGTIGLLNFRSSSECGLICTSLLTNDLGRLFMSLFANFVSSLVKHHFKSFAKSCIRLFFFMTGFWVLVCSEHKSFINLCFVNIFPQSVACLFILLRVSWNGRS